MRERRWRGTAGRRRGLFQIDVDDGKCRPATTTEVDAALRCRKLFGAADPAAMEVGRGARCGDPNQRTPLAAGLDGRERGIGASRAGPSRRRPTSAERVTVAALDEMPDEVGPDAVRAGRPRPVPRRSPLIGTRDVGVLTSAS